MCGSMNDVLGLGKLEKFSTCWSHCWGTLVFGTFRAKGLLEQGRIAGGDCKTVHARAPDAQPVKCIISENPPTSGLALSKLGGSSILGTAWSCACLWSVVDEPSLGQRTKKVGVCVGVGGGGRVCPGRARHMVLRPHLGRVGGVNAVRVHQGHARSASHWQARSTDLKLSQPPLEVAADGAGSGQLVRCGLAGAGYPGTAGLPRGVGPEFRTRTPGRDRGLQPPDRDRQAGRPTGQTDSRGKGAFAVETRRCAGVGFGCRCRTRCSAQRSAQRLQGAGARPVREGQQANSGERPHRYSTVPQFAARQ